MRTQFVRQRRQDRARNDQRPVWRGRCESVVDRCPKVDLDTDVHKFTILRTSILSSRDLRGDRCPAKGDLEIGIE